MFIIFINSNVIAEVKMDKITYLMMISFRNQLRRCNVPPNHRPACSLISQQRCHPRAGYDSPRNKGTSRLTHSQGYTKTQPSQHSWVYQSLLCYIVPQALHSLPVLFRGGGEEGQPFSSICVVSSHQVCQAKLSPHPCSLHSPKTNHCTYAINQNHG